MALLSKKGNVFLFYCMKGAFLFIAFCLHWLCLYCQSSYHIATEQGLNTNMLTTILKDKNNYMWVGSYNGLHKHEGSSIKVFKRIGKDSASISGAEMHGLFEDSNGFIWVGTTAGLDKIDPVTNKIKHYSIRNSDKNSAYVGYIYSVFEDDKGVIWCRTDVAIFRLNPTTGAHDMIPTVNDNTGMPTPNAGYITGIKTSQGLWIQSTLGMVFYEYRSGKFYHRYYNPFNKPIFNLAIPPTGEQGSSDMRMDADSNIYFVNNDTWLIKFNLHTQKLDSFKFERPAGAWLCCYSIGIDGRNNIWIGTRHGGIIVFDNNTKRFTHIRSENNNSLISSNYIYSLCADYTGKMWVTSDRGLDIIDLYNHAVQRKFISSEPDFTRLAYQTGNMYEDKTGMYIPYYAGGVVKISNGKTEHFRITDTSFKRITSIYNDDKAGLLAATKKTFFKVDLKNNQLLFSPFNSPYANALKRTSGDILWTYKENETSIYFKKTNGNIYYYSGKDSLETIPSEGYKQLACISKDKKFLYYITPEQNLAKRELSTKLTKVIALQEKLKNIAFSFANTRAMVDDGKANIWMTGQNGVLCYNTSLDKIFTYTTAQGLSHSFTFSICADSKGRIWVCSLGGVDWYNAATGRFQNTIAYSSGTYMDAFGTSLVKKDDELCFVAGNNFFSITPDSLFTKKQVPIHLKVTEVIVNSSAVNWYKDDYLKNLSYLQNRIEVNFSLLDFSNQADVKFFYYMEGLEKDWIETSKNGVAYNSLPPGKYIFHVKALTASGAEIKEQISLPISISPPFWQTALFRFLITICICLILYFLYRRRIRSFEAKATMNQQMAELEGKALRAQMNPHFIFNCLNAIQELIVTKNYKESYLYLSKFSKLLRMVLNNSEKNLVPLQSEIEMNLLYLELESLRFKKSFFYEINIDKNVDAETILFPSLLIQPFIENAIWHGLMHKNGEKVLDISFKLLQEKIYCTIDDNGIGRAKSAEIKAQKLGAFHFDSKGTILAQQRIETLKQLGFEDAAIIIIDKYNVENNSIGTTVEIIIPLQKK